MRELMICCIVALATAAPQGYNYAAQQPAQQSQAQPHQQYGPAMSASTVSFLKDLQTVMAVQSANLDSNFGLPQVLSFANNNIEQYVGSASGATAPAQVPTAAAAQLQHQPQPQARYLAPTTSVVNSLHTSSGFDAAAYQQSQSQLQQQLQQQSQQSVKDAEPETVVTKRFYIHAAPEDEEEAVAEKYLTVGKPRKNYNVVFIKAPAKAAQKTALKITPAVSEEKTVIYVLDKKHDATDIDAQVHEPITTTVKPEVYFIKYKTPEEAAHAQQTIQAQYDALGGSTHISNEGIAPVSSVIGSLEAIKQANAAAADAEAQAQEQETQNAAAAAAANAQQQQQQEHAAAVNVQLPLPQTASGNAYLPPTRYYR